MMRIGRFASSTTGALLLFWAELDLQQGGLRSGQGHGARAGPHHQLASVPGRRLFFGRTGARRRARSNCMSMTQQGVSACW